MLKTFYAIKVYILTDSRGEWWETYKKDGSLRRFKPGEAEFNPDKEFKRESKAIRFADKELAGRRFQVVRYDPPIRPSITWRETVVHNSTDTN